MQLIKKKSSLIQNNYQFTSVLMMNITILNVMVITRMDRKTYMGYCKSNKTYRGNCKSQTKRLGNIVNQTKRTGDIVNKTQIYV
jgi:hypothetical protein